MSSGCAPSLCGTAQQTISRTRWPQGFLSEGVDLLRGPDDIAEKAKAAAYRNEFEFLVDVYTLGDVRVRDMHFSRAPQLLDLFTFRRGVEFASVSKDGIAPPEYLQRLSVFTTGTHDTDARFNLLFPNLIQDTNTLYSSGGSPEYRGAPFLHDTTTIRLQKKTVLSFPNLAFLRADFSNITTANSTYAEWGPASPHADPWAILPWSAHEVLAKNFTRSFAGYPPP